MWFLVRAVAVIAVIAWLSPHRGGAERFADAAPAGVSGRILAQMPERTREAALAETGRALARALPDALTGPSPGPTPVGDMLRGALAPAGR